ncbi:hypothetical protein PRIPAC_70801 [Pristionchus pacificus]|uniref:Uncharacterized protein n=1 Tax=Pristionchus pacificus TaxID=54126 RepID=A0A2A6C812_PRIPA|nr:hypothetical protein PRIPAC_70801 [Pristionchus pacificus]|eukprot:PDM74324.1 hypothetical protein PRIPAC_41680 [Pristionchus pacificus]
MGEQQPPTTRRINTVNPIMGDQRMLQHLMQEMSVETKENELKLKAMLDKYQQEVTGVVRSDLPQPPGILQPRTSTDGLLYDRRLSTGPVFIAPPLRLVPLAALSRVNCRGSEGGSGWPTLPIAVTSVHPSAYAPPPVTMTTPPQPPPSYALPPPSSQGNAGAVPPPSAMVQPSPQYHQYVPMGASASNSLQQAVQAMRQENIFLRTEVDRLTAKANTLQRLESEHGAIEAEYDALLREKERMEEMEKHALSAYETRIKVVEQERDSLRDQLSQSQHAHHLMTAAAAKIEEYNKLSVIVTALSRQKDELSMVVDRQRREIGSQTTTLEEQRKHIAVLETALGKAQERVQMSDKIIEEFRSEQRLKEASNGNGHSNGDDMILKLEYQLNEYQKRAEEADRMKNAMTHTFNEKIEGLQREKYDRDRKIAELTEQKERLIADLQLDSDTAPYEDDSRRRERDLNRMEEVRQKIQEKKKRVNRPQTKNVRSLTSWSSTTQLTPSTSTAESLPSLSTVTATVVPPHHRPAPPPPPPDIHYGLTTTATVIPSVSYTYAPPPPPSNNYTAVEYSNSRGITTTTVITNGNTVITKEADL